MGMEEQPDGTIHNELYADEEQEYLNKSPEYRSRCMFLDRLRNMQQDGVRWLSMEVVFWLMDDCDRLVSCEQDQITSIPK